MMLPVRSLLTSSSSSSLLSFRQFILSPFRRNVVYSFSSLSRPFSRLRTMSVGKSGLWSLRSRSNGEGAIVAAAKTTQGFVQTRGMKTRSSVKRLCDGCKVSRHWYSLNLSIGEGRQTCLIALSYCDTIPIRQLTDFCGIS